jgi:hypothetical protein
MSTPPEPWVPKNPEEWADVFAAGIAKDRSNREEAEAKAKAALDAAKGGAANGSGDTTPPKSWRERLLG